MRLVARVRRWVEREQPFDVEPPALTPEQLEPGRYDRATADAMAETATPVLVAPLWATARIDALRHQLDAKDRLIARLEADLKEQHPARPLPSTLPGLAHELEAVIADRARLERVNDELREQVRALRKRLALPGP
jgi:hypothetical protein